MGEPLFLGVIVGCGIGALACENTQELVNNIPSILGLGIKMGACNGTYSTYHFAVY